MPFVAILSSPCLSRARGAASVGGSGLWAFHAIAVALLGLAVGYGWSVVSFIPGQKFVQSESTSGFH